MKKLLTCFSLRTRIATVLSLLIMLSGNLQAQNLLVEGKVASDAGEVLPGVNIIIEGTTTGVVTDMDGNFKISVPSAESVLIIKYIGFAEQKITVGSQSFINVTLVEDVDVLEELVVIGYGQQKKKELTGAVGTVKPEELAKNATVDVGSAMQGQIAGVNVQAASGAPGESANITIRGISSINGRSNPLWVVDGVPYDGDPKLSPSEIKSIDVLKDAASAAIYGTRGAGGVILVTTRQGKAGEMKVSLDSYTGIQNIRSSVPLSNTQEQLYVDFTSKATLNGTHYGNSWSTMELSPDNMTNNTDMVSVLQNDNALIMNHSLSFRGGKDDITYSVVGNYFRQDGSMINSRYDRFNTRANVSFKKNRLKTDVRVGARLEDQTYSPWQLLLDAYRYSPFNAPLDPNQSIIQDPSQNENEFQNMSGLMYKLKTNDNRVGHHFNANIQMDYEIFKGLNFNTNIGGDFTDNLRETVNPKFVAYDEDGNLKKQQNRSRVKNESTTASKFVWENSFRYRKEFGGGHKISALALMSVEQYAYSSFFAEKFDIYNNEITTLNGAQADPNVGTGTGSWQQNRTNTLVGMLGRLQYDFRGKYLVSASVRRDGSSRMAPANRWGVFPSVSGGWLISEEDFFSGAKDVVDMFKLRASYGTTGNQNIPDYAYAPTIEGQKNYIFGASAANEQIAYGYTQVKYANSDVKWETSIQRNFGADLSFLKGKLSLSAEYYVTDKENMLMPVLVAPSAGVGSSGANSTVILNVGNMVNKGTELSVNYRHTGDFSWSVGANLTNQSNEITKMVNSDIIYLDESRVVDGMPNEDLVSVITVGREAGSFFMIKTDGVIKDAEEAEAYNGSITNMDFKPGDLKYIDVNGDSIIDINDRQYVGSGMPDFEVGMNINMDYKGFDFSMQWYGAFGQEILNGSKAYAYKRGRHKDLVHQWTPVNPTSDIPINRGSDHTNYRGMTDYWLEDGSYIRLRNVTLGYTIPTSLVEKIKLGRARVYVAAQNPLTFTKYTGNDPEVGGNGLSSRGIDKGSYPVSTVYRGGIQLDF